MKNNQKLPKFILVFASIALISAFGIFVLEKAKVTNFYIKPIEQVKEEPEPVNNASYSSARNTEQDEGEKIKQNLLSQSNKQNSDINISLSAAGQDEIGGPLIVKAIINGVNSGQCFLTLKNHSMNKEFKADIINLGSYFGCDGFNIPLDELNKGNWTLDLSVQDKTITKEIELN